SEVIAAMGMLPDLARRWRRGQAMSLDSIEAGGNTAKFLAAFARGSRVGLQIAVICTGAALVIRQEASPGTILAAAVITSRMLSPFEHLIDGWRQWVNAFAIAQRLRNLLRDGARARSTVKVPVGRA